jgi:NAD-dependent deacetylase
LVIGTSLQVYPAAGLVDYVPNQAEVFVVDPNGAELSMRRRVRAFVEKATSGMEKIKEILMSSF